MTAWWWEKLPKGTVVLLDGWEPWRLISMSDGLYWSGGGSNYYAIDSPVAVTRLTRDATVIYVPVTDVEPPVGSIVMTGPESYWEHVRPLGLRPWADPWDLGCQPKSWDELRPNVTRILRWGES